jgi:hypothetical protein
MMVVALNYLVQTVVVALNQLALVMMVVALNYLVQAMIVALNHLDLVMIVVAVNCLVQVAVAHEVQKVILNYVVLTVKVEAAI